MTCAIVAVQGAFIEHASSLEALGEKAFEIRQKTDLEKPFDRLILPGGESTVQGRLIRELDMFDPLHEAILGGMPVMGTCAGLILLAQSIAGRGDLLDQDGRLGRSPSSDGFKDETGVSCEESASEVVRFKTFPISVIRNGYGRQLGSFKSFGSFAGQEDVPMTFIRAPRIAEILSEDVEVLAQVEGSPVAARYGNQLVTAFHPELDDDERILEYFLSMS